MDNIELYENFYTSTYKKLSEIIRQYNDQLIENKKGYLLDNLKLFKELNSDGKLIRGLLIALGYKIAKNENIEYSFPLALAYEILQTSVLIHDDIIDNDNLRRGKKTVHYANYCNYREYNKIDAKKASESIGICVGDYGYYEANKIIINNYKNDPYFADVLNYYNDVVLKTIEGELIDVVLSFEGKYKLEEIDIEQNTLRVYKLKTAYYTIIGPLCLGLILGGINDDRLKDIKDIGGKIGIAFQIQDDILGIYSEMGKVQGSDIKEFKQTILFSNTVKDEHYKEELFKYYGKKDITEEEIEKVRQIFKDSGSYDYANNMMNKLYNEAEELLKSIEWIKEEDKGIIYGFIEYLRGRKK